jgi:hypothetical protein
LRQRILASEQKYARKIKQVSFHWPDEGLLLIIINKLEKVIAEGNELERKRKRNLKDGLKLHSSLVHNKHLQISTCK